MQNNAFAPKRCLFFQTPKNNNHSEQPEKITISQISNSQKVTRAPLSKFFPRPGENAISLILRRKLEGLLTMGGGGGGSP